MSSALRILVVLVCAGIVGCRSAVERRQEQLRALEEGSVEYHRVAADLAQRGDQNRERRAAFEQTANDLNERSKPGLTKVFTDTARNAISGNDGRNEWDKMPGFEGSSATIGEFQ
jgi:hypothetical protein